MPESYDEVLYPSHAFAQTHPERLGALATLFGMSPAPVERCRVLELGCGDGLNLIAMAYSLPDSRFTGVDLAAYPVAAGMARVGALGLKNVDLRQMDVTRIDAGFGQFDYIIAHGLYSWVPATVQEAIFEVCRRNLAPQGVAYISYNTYPGWHLRRMIRETLLHHIRDLADPVERLRQARALAYYIANWKHDKDSERDILRAEFERVLRYDPAHLFHDDLAEINEPLYFHEFMRRAAACDLQFLAEADFHELQPPQAPLPGPDAPRLPAPGDVIETEQYTDFVRCRRFRQTLLCHAGVRLERPVAPWRLRGLYIASHLRPESGQPDFGHGSVEKFVGKRNSSLATDFPAAKAALVELSESWPAGVKFEELLRRSRARVAAGQTDGDDWPEQIALELAAMLVKLYGAGFIEVAAAPPRFTLEVSERPQVSRLARLQLETGNTVVDLRQCVVEIGDEKARLLLRLADGTRDLPALRRDLSAAAACDISEAALQDNLRSAARGALLEG